MLEVDNTDQHWLLLRKRKTGQAIHHNNKPQGEDKKKKKKKLYIYLFIFEKLLPWEFAIICIFFPDEYNC